MACTRFNKNQGYIGIAPQVSKGTPVATPEIYIKATDETTLTPTMEFDQQAELGDGIYPGNTIKTLHKLDGSFNMNVRADAITLLFSLMMGDDTITGASAPYQHVIVPAEDPCDIGWFTIVRDVAATIQEEFSDCRIKEITIAGEAGNRITAAVSVLGLTSKPATLALTPTYETSNNMFLFQDGTYTKDGTGIATVSAFSITIRAVMNEADQTTGIELADAPVIRFEVETEFTIDMDASNNAEYDVVYYSGGAAATALDDGTLTLAFNNGLSGADERSLQIELHRVIYTAQPVECDASSDEHIMFTITAHGEKHATNGLITITTESARST